MRAWQTSGCTALCVVALSVSACAGEQQPMAESVQIAFDRLPDFQNPPSAVRLKTRLAAAPTTENLQELARSGFGAVELAIDADSPAQALTATLQTAKSLGLRVDLAPGGSMPYAAAGIPEADSMQQLSRAVSSMLVSDGTLAFAGAAPRPPESQLAASPTLRLVAVTAARVIDHSATPTLLDPESAIDLTPSLDAAGMLRWTVPPGNWLIFGFWQRATGQTANVFPPFQDPAVWSAKVPAESPGHYFMADIFSGAGIGKAIDYLAKNLFTPENLELLADTQFAHDSHEVQAEMFWTSALPEQFDARRGYSMIAYLPALHTPKEAAFDPLTPNWGVTPPLTREFEFTNDVGARVRYDFHRTLTDLYVEEYLGTFSKRLHAYGMSSRAQVAYNYLPLNMTRSGAAVDIPENESFDSGWPFPHDPTLPAHGSERWRHAMDSYRLTGSGVHLSQGKRATIEFGDDFAIYRKQPVDYAQQLNEGFAGGITLGLLTMFAGVSSEWPAPTGLAMLGIGDSWTTAWPQWRDWPQLTDYFARSTLVLETGKARVDVVIYLDEGMSGVRELTTPKFASSTLEAAGFTYDFIDPVSLTAANASEVSGVLFGNGPSYRAFVLDQEASIPADAARTILDAAKRGLTVIVVGEAPRRSAGLRAAAQQDESVVQAMTELLQLGNVAQVASADEVAGALLAQGRKPAASFGTGSALLSVQRRTDQGEDLFWIFNPSDHDLSVGASFATRGTPYQLDLWNGTTSRVAQWTESDGRVSLPLVLPAHASTALMFVQQAAPVHVTATTAQEAIYDADTLMLRDTRGGTQDVTLSDGTQRTILLPAAPPAIQVGPWQLSVEELSPAGSAHHQFALPVLRDWREIPDLQHAVGSATYTASVNLPPSLLNAELDVSIDVGAVAGAMQLTINGTLVTKQTTPGGKWSVRKLLTPGDNQIVVRLDTTLQNRMAQLSDGSVSSAASGLIGPVQLIPAALGRIETLK
jgi:hypothetical protein